MRCPCQANTSSPPMAGSTICSTAAATTSPPIGIELQGDVRLRCGPTSAELPPQLELPANVALGRPRDDNLTVPSSISSRPHDHAGTLVTPAGATYEKP